MVTRQHVNRPENINRREFQNQQSNRQNRENRQQRRTEPNPRDLPISHDRGHQPQQNDAIQIQSFMADVAMNKIKN
jgi:hypothetical protein